MATAQAASIQVVEVTKRYGQGPDAVLALDAVSLEIRGNEFFTLLGPSGCGKTTLLRMIAGFDEPTAGEIRLDDKTLSGLPPFRRPVNTVFQSYALFPHLNVRQNVAFGLEMQRRAAAEIGPEVDRALAMVRLRGFEDRWPRQLSGGQQQRVALARALANRPRVLLLDEPLSALDLKLRKEMQLELKRLQLETGITFVFVTHDQEEALTMSDRIAVMDHGQVLQIGPPTEIYDRPATKFVADFIGETDLLEAVVEGPDEGGMRFRLPGGGSLTAAESPAMAPGSKVTLAFRPERVDVLPPGRGGIPADVTATVYTGTDTMAHLTLAGGVPVRARLQNREGAADLLRPGEKIEISVAPAAVRVLAA